MNSLMSMRTMARLVVEQERGERLGQLGLADAGRAQEDERADRPVGVLQAGARAPHGGRDGLDRLVLADHALGQRLLHAQQLVALAFEHAVDGNAGPARDDLGDVVGGDGLLDHARPWPSSPSSALSFFSSAGMTP